MIFGISYLALCGFSFKIGYKDKITAMLLSTQMRSLVCFLQPRSVTASRCLRDPIYGNSTPQIFYTVGFRIMKVTIRNKGFEDKKLRKTGQVSIFKCLLLL